MCIYIHTYLYPGSLRDSQQDRSTYCSAHTHTNKHIHRQIDTHAHTHTYVHIPIHIQEAHASADKQGLRILHRTTVKGMIDFDPPEKFGLPPQIDIQSKNPFGSGVFIGGGLGFRWDPSIRMQN